MRGARRIGILIAGLVAVAAAPACAEWAPAPFAPEIGSRWRVAVTDSTTDSLRGTTGTLTYGFDLTYEARTDAGYRILYVLKTVETEGNAPSLPVASAAIAVLKDLPIRAVTDADGRPIALENAAEVTAAVRIAGDRLVSTMADTPQAAAVLRRLLGELASTRGPAAAQAYLAPLPLLAEAQNTPLEPGDEVHARSALPSPFGPPILSEKVVALGPDPRPDLYVVTESEALDAAAAKAALDALTQRLTPKEGDKSPPQIALSVTRMQRIEVAGGMSRHAHTEERTDAQFAGQTAKRHRQVDVTVTPAP